MLLLLLLLLLLLIGTEVIVVVIMVIVGTATIRISASRCSSGHRRRLVAVVVVIAGRGATTAGRRRRAHTGMHIAGGHNSWSLYYLFASVWLVGRSTISATVPNFCWPIEMKVIVNLFCWGQLELRLLLKLGLGKLGLLFAVLGVFLFCCCVVPLVVVLSLVCFVVCLLEGQRRKRCAVDFSLFGILVGWLIVYPAIWVIHSFTEASS